jgi:NAD(P)-dependent dehydrogenase (short-subunit alcohol dehydrogenase family)
VSQPFDSQRLDARVLIVTGGTQGRGAEIARRSAGLGAAGIVICGRDRDRGQAVPYGDHVPPAGAAPARGRAPDPR